MKVKLQVLGRQTHCVRWAQGPRTLALRATPQFYVQFPTVRHLSLKRLTNSTGISKLVADHHQNSTNTCILVAEAVKAFESHTPAAN